MLTAIAIAIATTTPTANTAPPLHPPEVVFRAQRIYDGGDRTRARALIIDALAADPDSLWLNDRYQRYVSSDMSEQPRLAAEYRALLESGPTPARKVLLAMAISRTGLDPDDTDRASEALTLLEGLTEFAPWPELARADILGKTGDRTGRRSAIEAAWQQAPGHGMAGSYALRQSAFARDAETAAAIGTALLEAEPRFAGILPILTPNPMEPAPAADRAHARLLAMVESTAEAHPADAELQFTLYEAYTASGDQPAAAAAARRIRELDPAWSDAARDRSGRSPVPVEDMALMQKLMMGGRPGAEPDDQRAFLESLSGEIASAGVAVKKMYYAQLARLYATTDIARSLELHRAAAEADPGDHGMKSSFAMTAARAGESLDEAGRMAAEARDGQLDETRATTTRRRPGTTWWRDRARAVAQAIATEATVSHARGDLAAARRALLLATLVDDQSASLFARLGAVERELGHDTDAFEAHLRALTIGFRSGDPQEATSRAAIENLVPERYARLEVDALVALERQLGPMPNDSSDPRDHPLTGEPVPAFTASLLGGGETTPADRAGRPLVLSFWATWCTPCKPEMAALADLRGKLGDDVAILAVSVDTDDDWEARVPEFVRQNGAGLTVAHADEKMQSAFRVMSLPSLFVIDAGGTVRHFHVGYRPDLGDLLTKELAALTASASPAQR